jgi:Flp pilus assembly protein TadG
MTSSRPRRHHDHFKGDDGAVIVEAALVMPVLLWLIMALFDFSLMELKQSQVSSASRDGARTGIITWNNAQVGTYNGGACPATPTSYNSICNAVLRRLAGSDVNSITVRCFDWRTGAQKNCVVGSVNQGLDLLEVTVTYSYRPLTNVGQVLLGSSRSFTSSTRMVLL